MSHHTCTLAHTHMCMLHELMKEFNKKKNPFFKLVRLWSTDTEVSVMCAHLLATQTREFGQPARGVQEEKAAPLGVWVLWTDSPKWAWQTSPRVSQSSTGTACDKLTFKNICSLFASLGLVVMFVVVELLKGNILGNSNNHSLQPPDVLIK